MSNQEVFVKGTMNPTEPRRNTPRLSEPQTSEARHLYQLSSGMTLEEFRQWQEMLMINPVTAVNPLLTATGQQRIPLLASPFEPQTVDRDFLPSTLAPMDSRQFNVPSQFGFPVLPNANVQTMLSNREYSGWGILPPESIRAMARRNEMIQRHNTARTEMEMHAIYQQRRMEKINPQGLVSLGIPFFYGSRIPAGPAAHHGRSLFPASDLHFHRRAVRNLQGNPMLVATGPCFLESWGQKCRLRRGTGNQKVVDSDTYNSKSQAEIKILGQTLANPSEEDEYAKDPETETHNTQKPRKINDKPITTPTNTYRELESTCRNTWAAHGTSLEPKAWDGGKEKAFFAACSENEVCPTGPPPALPGTHRLVPIAGHLSLDENIQKWTVDDVHDFISGLPGCSGYAQVFKDHAIDGEILPLLTEEHLRDTMGLKLGPALKIQSQVSQQLGSMLHKKSLLLPTHTYSTRQAFDQPADTSPLLDFNSWGDTLGFPCSQDIRIPKGIEQDKMKN